MSTKKDNLGSVRTMTMHSLTFLTYWMMVTLATVSSLIDAGKYVYYITDAVAGLDNEKENATIKVLEGLAPLHLSIITTNEFKALARNNTGLSKLNLF